MNEVPDGSGHVVRLGHEEDDPRHGEAGERARHPDEPTGDVLELERRVARDRVLGTRDERG